MRLAALLLAAIFLVAMFAAVGAVDTTSATKVTLNVSSPSGVTGFFVKTGTNINTILGEILSEAVDFVKSAVAYVVKSV